MKGTLDSKTKAKGNLEATASPMGPLGRLSGWAWSVSRGPFNQGQASERRFTSGSALGLGFHSTESLKGWFSQHQVILVSQKRSRKAGWGPGESSSISSQPWRHCRIT